MVKERLYKKYCKKFKGCFDFKKPVTEGEIINYLHKTHSKNTGLSLFEQKYLPKLRELALVAVIIKDHGNIKLLKKYYNIDWKDMIRRYYVFTPKTAEINQTITKIIERFGDYLKNKKQIYEELDKLITNLLSYEILFYSPITPKDHVKKDPKIENLNEAYLNNYGNLFDYMFNNEKNYTHPESFQHRMVVRLQFIKVMGLLNQQIQVSKIFFEGFDRKI